MNIAQETNEVYKSEFIKQMDKVFDTEEWRNFENETIPRNGIKILKYHTHFKAGKIKKDSIKNIIEK